MSSQDLPDRIHLPGDTAQEFTARIRDRIHAATCEHIHRTETTGIGVADLTYVCNDCGTHFSEPRPQ